MGLPQKAQHRGRVGYTKTILFGVQIELPGWRGVHWKAGQVPDTSAHCLAGFRRGNASLQGHCSDEQSMAEAETRASYHPHFLASQTH